MPVKISSGTAPSHSLTSQLVGRRTMAHGMVLHGRATTKTTQQYLSGIRSTSYPVIRIQTNNMERPNFLHRPNPCSTNYVLVEAFGPWVSKRPCVAFAITASSIASFMVLSSLVVTHEFVTHSIDFQKAMLLSISALLSIPAFKSISNNLWLC